MGVDWYACKNCENTFPDCGDYVYCECGEHWCSDECASADGYIAEDCKLGCEVQEQYLQYDGDEVCKGIKDESGEVNCFGCSNYIEESCGYCRKEVFEDGELLEKALLLLEMTREELVKKMKE